uniref:Uncharacterized protein n=1 Tax=uncultured Acidobacteria bacterium HF4000_26D02 TaxID=710731 RepID=E0XW85_9BACT|nr:hypothetical protein [uncultured Acidobacteria bacterium HF4000_26D02]
MLAELVEHGHQPVYREAAKLHIADAGEIGVADAGSRLGFTRGQAFFVEHPDDAGGEERLGLLHVGIGTPEIAEHVATAAHQLKIVVLFRHDSSSFFNRFSRSRMRSRSFRLWGPAPLPCRPELRARLAKINQGDEIEPTTPPECLTSEG